MGDEVYRGIGGAMALWWLFGCGYAVGKSDYGSVENESH